MKESYDYQQTAEKVLAAAYGKANSKRNWILTGVIALTVCLLFCILSLANGKLEVDTLRNMRSDGMAVSAYIENSAADMGEQLVKLPYVSQTAKEKLAGKLLNGKVKYCDCAVLDQEAYEMIQPAYSDITGAYPKEVNEIMLSVKTLAYLGIEHPEVGMRIHLEFYWNDLFQTKLTGVQEFVLSGYFTDYQNQSEDSSVAYISENRMKESGISWEPCRVLMQMDKEMISGEEIETYFRRDVELEKGQKLFCTDSAKYRALTGVFGSFGFALLFSAVTLLCMFLFIYNVLNISMSRDVRQYGLLGTLGVTSRQIRGLIYRQMAKAGLGGIIIGGITGSIIVCVGMPEILAGMYLEKETSTEGLAVYHISFLLVAAILAGLVLFFAAHSVMKKIIGQSPIENMKYEETTFLNKTGGKQRERHRGKPVFYISWAYLMRNKKAFLVSVASLVLGCEIALCSFMVVKGVDMENLLSENPDFRIGLTQKACTAMMEYSPDTAKLEFFPQETIKEIQGIADNGKETEYLVRGFIPIIKKNTSIDLVNEEDSFTVIQCIEKKEQKILDKYIQDHKKNVDLENFYKGQGVIILHNNQLSEAGGEYAAKQIGHKIEAYDLVPVGTDMNGLPTCSVINCGYLNIAEDSFPLRNVCWNGEGGVVLLVTEDTFRKLSETLTPQTLEIDFEVKNEQETLIKSELQKFIRMSNMEMQSERRLGKANLFFLDCNSDRIAKERNYMMGSRLILFSISIILLFIGIMNYLNIRVTDMISRKKEMAILESVGMTRKQLHAMLTMEGMYFCLIIIGILLTAGTGILYAVGKYMKMQIPYFVSEYPWKLLGVLLVVLAVFSVGIPRWLYRKTSKKSSIEELHDSE